MTCNNKVDESVTVIMCKNETQIYKCPYQICFPYCLVCNGIGTLHEQKCTECSNKFGKYFKINHTEEDNCYNETTKKEKYYLDREAELYKKCNIACSRCDKKENDTDFKITVISIICFTVVIVTSYKVFISSAISSSPRARRH